MRQHLTGICGVAIVFCAMCVASSAGGADANARTRNRSAAQGTQAEACATESAKQGGPQGTQAEARHGGQACATEGAALAQSAMQTQGAAQAGGVTQAQVAAKASGADLHLLPRAREVKETGGGAFVVTRRTRIVVSSALGGKNFEGAQMLAEEIARWTGSQPKITAERTMPGGSDVIYIGDATKDSKLQSALEKQGLSMQTGFDEQGYEISADAHRVLVGGASAEGAFNGVQTLRQLLRPANVSNANEKADSSAPFANTATGLGMTSKPESASESKNYGGSAGGAKETAEAGSSAPFANTATGLGMTSKTESASESKNYGGAEGGAKETAEADSSESRLPSGPLGMTEKNNGAASGLETVNWHLPNSGKRGSAGRAEKAGSSALFANTATGLGMTSKTENASGASENKSEHEKNSAKADAKNRSTNSAQNIELICPAVAIRDWPAMKWRGVSVDISRGPIPTLKFMENQIRVLAGFKLNMYALYMEDVFTVPGNQIFAPRDALTPDEIRELVAYAQKYYVTIVPELETYGHLHNVLRYDVYSQLAEVPHGSVLTPTQPGSYDLLGKMIAAMAPIFKGPLFHIGADETFELGEGQTKELIAEKGLGQVYLAHIAKLDEMLKPYHKQTMFWADIAEKFPELLSTLPKDVIAVVWTYGNEDSYDARLQPFRAAGLPIFVSPGISNWRRVYPDFNNAYMNIRNLTRDGQKFSALGILNTEWKDWGEALGGMDWPGFVFGAACAWQPGESSVEQFRDSYDWAFYRNTDHTFEDILDKLAATNTLLDGVKLNGTYTSYFWADPFSQAGADYAETAAPVTHDVRVNAEQAWESLLENRGKARANAETIDDLVFAARRLDALGMKLEYTKEMSESYWDAFMNMGDRRRVQHDLGVLSAMNGQLQDLREVMTGLRDEYAARWRAENGEFWLGNVTIRYDTMANSVQSKINMIEALKDNYSRLGELPSPESMGFFARPAPQQGGH